MDKTWRRSSCNPFTRICIFTTSFLQSYLVTRTTKWREKHARRRPNEAAEAEVNLLLANVLNCEGMADAVMLQNSVASVSYPSPSGRDEDSDSFIHISNACEELS